MKAKAKVVLLTLILSLHSVVWASSPQVPAQPNKCPNLNLIQQKKDFLSALKKSNFYIGASQVGAYDTNVFWLVMATGNFTELTSSEAAMKEAQRIIDGATGQPIAIYDEKLNAWVCNYETNSKVFKFTRLRAFSGWPIINIFGFLENPS